jgi:hypothetical protein
MAEDDIEKRNPGKPKYGLDLEGTIYPWNKATITVPEIRQLAGWNADQPVVEVNSKTGAEKTLAEDAVVKLKPGQGFGKKVRFQRG